MTPAEKPSETARKRGLVFLAKNASALPMPVDNPAIRVSAKAIITVFVSIADAAFYSFFTDDATKA